MVLKGFFPAECHIKYTWLLAAWKLSAEELICCVDTRHQLNHLTMNSWTVQGYHTCRGLLFIPYHDHYPSLNPPPPNNAKYVTPSLVRSTATEDQSKCCPPFTRSMLLCWFVLTPPFHCCLAEYLLFRSQKWLRWWKNRWRWLLWPLVTVLTTWEWSRRLMSVWESQATKVCRQQTHLTILLHRWAQLKTYIKW